MSFLLLFFILVSPAAEVAPPEIIIKQLTGIKNYPGGRDFGDPSAPDFSQKNFVRVYTTGGDILSWQSTKTETALKKFLAGKPPNLSRLKVYHSDGVTEFDELDAGEDIWDPTVEVINGKRILFAGAMTAKPGEVIARWPDDHWSRRTFVFDLKGKRWVQRKESVFGSLPKKSQWVGHNYGHHFILDEKNQRWMFYEKVTEENDGAPTKTELFARQLDHTLKLTGREISILKIPQNPWPAAIRGDGNLLVEGPRPFKFGDRYFISFSAGDYFAPNYGIHLLSADKITGPYEPYLTSRGNLKDFGARYEKQLPLTWGAARAVFFEAEGQWWVLFHGVPYSQDQGFLSQRQIYLAPAFLTLDL